MCGVAVADWCAGAGHDGQLGIFATGVEDVEHIEYRRRKVATGMVGVGIIANSFFAANPVFGGFAAKIDAKCRVDREIAKIFENTGRIVAENVLIVALIVSAVENVGVIIRKFAVS